MGWVKSGGRVDKAENTLQIRLISNCVTYTITFELMPQGQSGKMGIGAGGHDDGDLAAKRRRKTQKNEDGGLWRGGKLWQLADAGLEGRQSFQHFGNAGRRREEHLRHGLVVCLQFGQTSRWR